MTESALYQRADDMLGPYLRPKGFARWRPAEYRRTLPAGFDRISVSKSPPSKATLHFAVFMSYYPSYLGCLNEIISTSGEDIGYPCGPYLNPVGASRRPKYWSFKNDEALSNSLAHVLECLENTGLTWLESLRDPKVFAANVDPTATLDFALANEVAGNTRLALQGYAEMLRRLEMIIDSRPGERILIEEVAKPFIFVASKLGMESALCEEFKRKTDFRPHVKPLAAT